MKEVELDLGAYVKSAIQFTNNVSEEVKLTGRGTLYGGDYVYQANPDEGYKSVKDDINSLRMLWHRGNDLKNQKFTLDSVTVAAPPFNVHDFCYGGTCGTLQGLRLEANDYKQVGAFFAQTDGLMPYSGSISNSFLHVN